MIIWVRWMWPRFRYDQLMDLGWRRFLPLALANIIVTAVWLGGFGDETLSFEFNVVTIKNNAVLFGARANTQLASWVLILAGIQKTVLTVFQIPGLKCRCIHMVQAFGCTWSGAHWIGSQCFRNLRGKSIGMAG